MLTAGVCLLHNNARSYTVRLTTDLLNLFEDILNNPSYSLSLAPSDFHFSSKLKKRLNCLHFTTNKEIKEAF